MRNDVLNGFYKPGEAIRQEEVVARYQVSRTPVREALIHLEQEGLVVTTPNCGARVASQASDAIHGLLNPIRRTIEAHALRSYFDDLTEVDFHDWEQILDEMKNACVRREMSAIAEHDVAFHRSIIERANEPRLVKIWQTLVSQIQCYFLQSHAEYSDLMDIYREHKAILGVMRQGDRDAAVNYLADRIGDPIAEMVDQDYLSAFAGSRAK
ncbi:GntR family transcriptional regulator [Blastopirellula sp. J2-11]|uniref:GntR family transcriptional regulator n=1 Tax=Blastopirellula sp. J2-11 TaxID=2943192 RepID=UPI0021C6845D|nr:GntR family transcriptional regulator [Blastopirellula sp. J2-11]UUO04380.1 GntR family transcriptional regulator [Blastopirellula sp. J2-11]